MLINRSNIDLIISAPPSKSESIRALLIALLSAYPVIIENLSICEDSKNALKILELRKTVHNDMNTININNISNISNSLNTFQCGESAFLLRALSGILPYYFNDNTLLFQGSLINRDKSDIFDFFIENSIDYAVSYDNIRINYISQLNDISISAKRSSQLLSGLLIANAFFVEPVNIIASEINSIGYVDLTLNMLENIGINYNVENSVYSIITREYADAIRINVTGDWSGAAFFLVAGAIAGKVEISGLDVESKQPDRAILHILQEVGANISSIKTDNSTIVSCSKNVLEPFEFDATHCPDLIPILTVLAINCNGLSKIVGINRLANKESNRQDVLLNQFRVIGAKIEEFENEFHITGTRLSGGKVCTYSDHRIAMAMSIAALTSENPIILDNADCVNKSYPNFFDHLFFASKQNL